MIAEKVEIFLETPVADDDGTAGAAQSATADGTSFATAAAERLLLADAIGGGGGKNAVKPKRLSDEFYSADDGSEADNEDDEQPEPVDQSALRGIVPSPAAQRPFATSPFRQNPHAFAVGSPRNVMFIDGEAAAAAEVADAPQSPPTFDDASPKSSTLDADDAQMQLLDNEDARDDGNYVDVVNDMNSMDAIERLDVEEEHRLTGSGGLMRCRQTMVAGGAESSARWLIGDEVSFERSSLKPIGY